MANNVPGFNPAFDSIYNPSGFDGQVSSDFLKLGGIPSPLRKDLIDFSTADFDEFADRLKEYIKSVYPEDYNNFVESDLGQMLVELFAYMAAVLSFKADAIAQENYLATAKTSEGITKLLELIGISRMGPVPAKATAKLTIQDNADFLSGSDTLTVSYADRIVETISTRDNLPLSYTLYSVDSNGNIDMQSRDLTLTTSDFDSSGLEANGLLLLEGRAQIQEGVFKTGVSTQKISIPSPSVIEGSIVVSSVDGFYTEVENIWFASSDSQVFQKKYNEDFSCELLFGDGVVGKSPTPGSPYLVMYRTGGGLRGNIGKEQLTKSLSPLKNGVTPVNCVVVNTTAGTGGQNAQSIEEARRFGPMWFATQYRAVTGQDYTAFINKFRSTTGKTGKGIAVLRDNGSAGNMIDIYVLQKATENHLERASFEFKKELLEYLSKYKMMTDELTVVDGLVRTLDLVTTLYVDKSHKMSAEDIKKRVSNTILEFFSTNNMDFGTPLIVSELVNQVLKDSGVRFFSVDNYVSDIFVDFNEIIQLNNLEINIQFV